MDVLTSIMMAINVALASLIPFASVPLDTTISGICTVSGDIVTVDCAGSFSGTDRYRNGILVGGVTCKVDCRQVDLWNYKAVDWSAKFAGTETFSYDSSNSIAAVFNNRWSQYPNTVSVSVKEGDINLGKQLGDGSLSLHMVLKPSSVADVSCGPVDRGEFYYLYCSYSYHLIPTSTSTSTSTSTTTTMISTSTTTTMPTTTTTVPVILSNEWLSNIIQSIIAWLSGWFK